MKRSRILLITFFLLYLRPVSVQAYNMTKHLNTSTGLSNSYIHGIIQDSQGRVWIATESGLNCYDGYHIHNYSTYDSQLKSNIINILYHDAFHHKIWIGTKGNGLAVLDERTGVIRDMTPKNISFNNVISFTSDHHNRIWFATHNKIIRYDYTTNTFSLVFSARNKAGFRGIFYNGREFVIADYYSGLTFFETKKQIQRHPGKKILNGETVNVMTADGRGYLWLGTNCGLWKMNLHTHQLKSIATARKTAVNSIIHDGKNNLLIASNSEVFLFNTQTSHSGLICNIHNVENIYEDQYHNLWLGTFGDGCYFMGQARHPFRMIDTDKTWSIYPDGSRMWAGGKNKLILLQKHHVVKIYPLSFQGMTGHVMSLCVENKQDLVLAAYGRLLRFSKQTGKLSEIKINNKSIPAITFYKDNRTGILWIAAYNGIYTILKGKVRKRNRLNRTLSGQMTNGIRIDSDGKIWIGTFENGIYVFDKKEKLIRHLSQQDAFFTNVIMHLQLGSRNRLWMATPEGVGLINTKNPAELKNFGYKEGLKDLFIRAIREDHLGNVWVSTNNGISYLDMKKIQFFNFGKDDGIPTQSFTGGLILQPDGSMYATSLDGICCLDSRSLTARRKTSQVAFLSCTILSTTNENLNERLAKPSGNTWMLSHDENTIKINVAVGNKAQSEQVDYSYRVDHLTPKWTITDGNEITFYNLSPGKYTIHVRARLHGQSWQNASTASMDFTIQPPLWWSAGARWLYVLSLAAIICFLFQRYNHHLKIRNDLELEKRKNAADQDTNNERLQFFTNIAHELRIPLTLIFGPVNELEKSGRLSEQDRYKVNLIKQNSNRLLELINRLLEFQKAETHNLKMTVSLGNISETIAAIGNEFKDSCTNPDVHFILKTEQDIPAVYYDRNIMKSILCNLLNNAVKYTAHGEIGISLTSVIKAGHHYSAIRIWDSGCGIPEYALTQIFDNYYQVNGKHQASGTGIGLALVKKLCKQHHIGLSVDSKVGHGTCFTLLLDNEYTYPEALHQESDTEEKTLFYPKTNKNGTICHEKDTTVLIVEDNLDINNFIACSLENEYNILQADNGQEGLECAEKNLPDLIICDVMMPVMNGNEMTKSIKNNISTSHIPVIMLTAKSTIDDQKASFENGADAYITKPFSIDLLKTRIKNILGARKISAQYVLQQMTNPTSYIRRKCMNAMDQRFMNNLNEIISDNIASGQLTLNFLAGQMNISQSTLYRKVKALTGISGNEYIRKIRLNYSRKLMTEGNRNISEAAYKSGFTDISYFRHCFKEEFGMIPSEYQKVALKQDTDRDIG